MAREKGLTCTQCQRQTLHRQETTNDLVHLLIVLFSCGLWLIPWFFMHSSSLDNPWLCSQCGTETSAIAERRQTAPVQTGPLRPRQGNGPLYVLFAVMLLLIALSALQQFRH